MEIRKLVVLFAAGVFAALPAQAEIGNGSHPNAQDVSQMTYKVRMAADYFEAVWSSTTTSKGVRYNTPTLTTFSGSVNTGCGLIQKSPAFYCPNDNHIYYNPTFLASLMVLAGNRLGTDGDYAAIVVVAHEWGHLVQHQLHVTPSMPIMRELQADCLAGAVTLAAARAGHLERGDFEEAIYAFSLAGDDPGGSVWSDSAHGSPEMRIESFKHGYQGGLQACRLDSSALR